MSWPTAATPRLVPSALPLTLRFYRALTAAAVPFAPWWLNKRLRRGKENQARLGERYGHSQLARPRGPLVWIHGASVGEFTTVLPLIDRMRKSAVEVLVTTGTVTSANLAAQRLRPDVVHQFLPLDAPRFVRRFLDHWRPDIVLFAESDLWPNFIVELHRRGIPLILINGRMSARSFSSWRYLRRTIRSLLTRFDLCLVRTPDDAMRFGALGAPRITTTGNLKLDVPAPPADATGLSALQAAVGERPVVLAASTHPGEETAVIEAHRQLRQSFPKLLSVIVPRHPERGSDVAGLAKANGLNPRLRSHNELPDAACGIYVADTIGELGLFYRLAPVVFIGGSLVRHGGQNPIEAAKLGAAIVHGPHVGNFSDIYAALDKAHGAAVVTDSAKLALRIGAWLGEPNERERFAQAARGVVDGLGGAMDRTAAAVEPYLMQLRLEHHEATQHRHA